MPSSDYLPFATGGSANVESQGSYAGSSIQVSGFQTGLAPSNVMNKAVRQSSMMAAAIAQFLVNQLGINIPDDGNLSNLITNFKNAIWASVGLTGVPTAPTQASSDSSARIATTAFVQSLVAILLSDIATAQSNAETYAAGLLGAFVLSGGNPGYFQIPAIGAFPGLIINWGNSLVPGAGFNPIFVTYALAFPTGTFAVYATPAGDTAVPVGAVPGSGSTIALYNHASVNIGVYWLAIGY